MSKLHVGRMGMGLALLALGMACENPGASTPDSSEFKAPPAAEAPAAQADPSATPEGAPAQPAEPTAPTPASQLPTAGVNPGTSAPVAPDKPAEATLVLNCEPGMDPNDLDCDGSPKEQDCNDNDATIKPHALEDPDAYKDISCDGFPGAATHGLFVSFASGNDDTGDGSFQKPLKTLTKATGLAHDEGKLHIYLLNDGPHELEQTAGNLKVYIHQGLSLYGGYSYTDANKSSVTRTASAKSQIQMKRGTFGLLYTVESAEAFPTIFSQVHIIKTPHTITPQLPDPPYQMNSAAFILSAFEAATSTNPDIEFTLRDSIIEQHCEGSTPCIMIKAHSGTQTANTSLHVNILRTQLSLVNQSANETIGIKAQAQDDNDRLRLTMLDSTLSVAAQDANGTLLQNGSPLAIAVECQNFTNSDCGTVIIERNHFTLHGLLNVVFAKILNWRTGSMIFRNNIVSLEPTANTRLGIDGRESVVSAMNNTFIHTSPGVTIFNFFVSPPLTIANNIFVPSPNSVVDSAIQVNSNKDIDEISGNLFLNTYAEVIDTKINGTQTLLAPQPQLDQQIKNTTIVKKNRVTAQCNMTADHQLEASCLAAIDTAKVMATPLPGESAQMPLVDIDGDTREANKWDIGADEFTGQKLGN
jgi:hypothetical protein